MGQIADFEAFTSAKKVLEESERIGVQAVGIATQMVQLAKQFVTLKANAADPADEAVFDARFAAAVAASKAQMGSLTIEEKALLQTFFDGAMAP